MQSATIMESSTWSCKIENAELDRTNWSRNSKTVARSLKHLSVMVTDRNKFRAIFAMMHQQLRRFPQRFHRWFGRGFRGRSGYSSIALRWPIRDRLHARVEGSSHRPPGDQQLSRCSLVGISPRSILERAQRRHQGTVSNRRGEVDIELLAVLALDQLNFGRITHA